ncbi:MAG: hypothetical protein A2039_00825 [Candidatus Melainabacteria bacterium GWA2_34_9]|nr:MAG: hypothetical protein A2039_00825 [Candidatus Melainabacteria bacterium GWA2_34_9]
MKDTAVLENLNLDFLTSELRKNCLSPQNNSCSFLKEAKIQENKFLSSDFHDKTLKSEEYQEKICSECIWHRKNH